MTTMHRILLAVGGPVAFALGLVLPVCTANAQSTVQLEVQGLFSTFVTGAAGVGSESEVIEHKVVDASGHEIVRKIPGRLKYLDITLERGLSTNRDLADWRKLVETGEMNAARTDIFVTLFDMTLRQVARWDGTECWPARIENLLPDPTSETSAAVEKMVIVCEGLTRAE